jgi:hypothetical protein
MIQLEEHHRPRNYGYLAREKEIPRKIGKSSEHGTIYQTHPAKLRPRDIGDSPAHRSARSTKSFLKGRAISKSPQRLPIQRGALHKAAALHPYYANATTITHELPGEHKGSTVRGANPAREIKS